jgi:Haem-degrading
MRSQVAMFVFAIVFGAETSAAHAQLLPRRDLSYSIAKTIAETAMESCTAGGYRVSAVVVDRDGETIVALRGNNASPHTNGERAPQGLHCPQLPHLNHCVCEAAG